MRHERAWMRVCLLAAMLGMVALAGCGGVWMNRDYSQLLDATATLSAECSKRADANQLTPAEMRTVMRLQAETWKKFQDARDGRSSTPAETGGGK